MSKRVEILLLLWSDLIFANLAWMAYFYIRIESGWIIYAKQPSFVLPMVIVYIYWLFVFSISGQYQHWYIRSRFEEIVSLFKTISIGCILIFLLIFIDDSSKDVNVVSRFLILLYWAFLILFVSIGRLFIRGFQKRALKRGYGLRNTIIVGTGVRAIELYETTKKYPEHGYLVKGFIGVDKKEQVENEIGKLKDIVEIIKSNNFSDILIATDSKQRGVVVDALNLCADMDVSIKIRPEHYEIISGMAKTRQLFGIPLIDVMPEILNYSSRIIKRIIDFLLSVLILLVTLPVLLISALIIKLTSPGPAFYLQERVGRNNKHFNVIKFRSMRVDAEDDGKKWAEKYDTRATSFGRFIRKIRLDELPQLLNVLKNDMSLVGPRPERPYFVELLKKEIPYYYRRLKVKPGITGWAQVNHPPDNTIEDVRIKLQYDFYYIENMSLSLDFQIMINTFVVIFTMRGY